jgi:chromosome partitioning protein|tara:strand:+ start:12189 stop:13340 length:1152 start_codon:yes stop_codon:yes gene_type:complete
MFSPGIEQLDEIIGKCEETLEILRDHGMSPQMQKHIEREFTVAEAEAMVGRSRATLSRQEKDPDRPVVPMKHANSGRVRGYTLDQINELRDIFGTSPRRKEGQSCKILSMQSFKGGVAKSVSTVYFAQYLAIRGYRVLVVDCDPQASATSSFGYIPDHDFTEEDTMIPYIDGKKDSIEYAVRQTYFPGIDLVPSCLPWYEVEFGLFNAVTHADTEEERLSYYQELRQAIRTVEVNYDVVLMDSPPALGMISINILSAADGVIVPTPPSMYDFASTTQYFKMVKRVIQSVTPEKRFDFIKVMPTKVERNKSRQMDFLDIMRDRFGLSMLRSIFTSASAIPNAASVYKTLYDLPKGERDNATIDMLDEVFGEIEALIRKAWEDVV